MRRALTALTIVLAGCYPHVVLTATPDTPTPTNDIPSNDVTTIDAADVAATDITTVDQPNGPADVPDRPVDVPTRDVPTADVPTADVSALFCGAPNLACPRSCTNPADISCQQVRIMGGTFAQGDAELADFPWLAAPVQDSITVSSFVMDVTEVTVERFRRFWNATNVANRPIGPVMYPNGASVSVLNRDVILEPRRYFSDHRAVWSNDPMEPAYNDYARHPIHTLNWYTAMSFCIWDGGRLPTESEWEFVARGRALTAPAGGGMPRRYPWGNDPPTCNRALTIECVGGAQPATQNVGALAARFVDGIADLAGNVAEYTASHFVGYDQPAYQNRMQTDPLFLNNPIGNRIARGGDAYDDTMHSRAASRAAFATADFAGLGVGLRCVRSLP